MRYRKPTPWLAGALLGGAALVAAGSAAAQDATASVGTTGFALQRFIAAPAGDRLFSVSSPYTSGDPGLHVALLLDYASNPLLEPRVKGVT